MSLNNEHIKTEIKKILPRKNLDEVKLDLFVADFIDGIMTGWKNVYAPSTKELSPEIKKLLPDLWGEEDFYEELKTINKDISEQNEVIKELVKRFQNNTNDFSNVFGAMKQWFLYEDSMRQPAYHIYDNENNNDDFLSFPERIERFEEDLQAILSVLQIELDQIPKKKKGRPADNSSGIFVRNIFVLCHCLLDIYGSISNNENPFNDILRKFYEISGYSADCAYRIELCFRDSATVYQMAFPYRKYGRLDLYIEHVLKTAHIHEIRRAFNQEWSNWEKPHNFQLLMQTKKSA